MSSASQLLIEKVEAARKLSPAEAEAFMEELLSGRVATPEIARMLSALNQRPITVEELAGFALVMRKHATPVFAPGELRPSGLVDTCGTGGDETGTFNISTASAIVAAAAGARVAKHGNRSVSSRSGSADVLEALGVRIDLPMTLAGRSVREIGIGFLFAPAAHAAARHAAAARQQIGKRTVFNLLGPLTNPAGAEAQVLGVFSAEVIDTVAATLAELGTHRAFVVHGAGGLDEISLSGETQIAEVRDGYVRRFTVTPEDFGVSRAPLESIRGGTPQENAELIHALLAGEPGPRLDIVIANAAAALVVTGAAEDFRAAAELARQAVASGKAREKLDQLKDFSHKHAPAK
ncbi:MAG TPA: anthranilate phosphoribosyltransferase [Candidatus Acidoferrum sp.]|nr:anthranilate phosphoribosyltransferase [Candidatus Acidoferrum sp.]